MTTKKERICGMLLPPVVILVAVGVFFAVFGIFPFGSKTVSWCDMNQQTVPLLMDLKDILNGRGSLFYSTGNAGGMNFWGVFLFFIASPMYLTVKFVEKSHIIYLVNILLAVKLALSAFTAAIYFIISHKKLNIRGVVLLSVMYALCGYGMMNYQTLVWLDIMCLFPLLVLSVRRMCCQHKPALYFAVLTAMMLINYYLSFMVVIYLMIAVPLFIFMICNPAERKRASSLFVISSFLAMLVTAPVWLCSFLQISSSARGENSFSSLLYKPFFESTGDKFAIVMCTAMCIAVIPFFIKNRICRDRQVKYSIILLIFLAVPVFADPVNKIWHTGSYQCFPFRYGFIVIFTMLTLVAHYLEYAEYVSKGSAGFSAVMILLAAVFFGVAVYTVRVKKQTLLSYVNTLHISSDAFKILFALAMFACMLYIICFMLLGHKFISRNVFYLVASMVFVTEFSVSFAVNVGYGSNSGDIFRTSSSLESRSDSDELVRMKSEKKYLHVNMLGGLGYDSMAHYTSLTSEQYMYAMKKLGYSSYWMEVGSNGGTCLTDALLAVGYSIGSYFDFKSYQHILDTEGVLKIAENTICATAGITGKKSPEEMKNLDYTDRFSVQKQLAENIFGTDEMLHKYNISYVDNGTVTYENGKYNIQADDPDMSRCQIRYSAAVSGHQILYFDIFDSLNNRISESFYNSVKVYVNGNCITSEFPSQKNNGMLCLGEFENETAEIMLVMTHDVSVKSFGVFGIDTDSLKKNVSELGGCTLHTDKNVITAKCISSDNETYLYLSVPYEKGLTGFINGKKTEIYRINDSFCAVKLESGTNKIKLKFIPPGMNAGIIMAVSGIVLALICKTGEVKKIFSLPAFGTISYKLCLICFYGVLAAVYIAPSVLRIAVKISDMI